MIKWINLFFNQREAYILLGGHLTSKIMLEQGVPQGDVISPYIFILMVEILLIKINYTKNLKGIRYAKKESRSETFADDTTVILERSEEYLRYAMKCLIDFHKLSGLQCNIDKTMVIPIGGITDPTIKICEDINLEWASEFKILGFFIDNKLEKLHSNVENCTRKVRAIINKWRKYNLTIMGRMTVTKALLLSQYTYVATVLDLTQKEVEYIQSILDNFILYNSFLNHGHKSRYWINQDIMYSNKVQGGLNAIRVSDFLLSLKVSWMHRYVIKSVNDHWCDQLDNILGLNIVTREDILHWGISKWEDVLQTNMPILTNILRAYKVFSENFVQGTLEKNNRWIEQPLFHNPNITNARNLVLRPQDYNIIETREISKLKVIDIYSNLKIRPIQELRDIGLNLNFLSHERLRKDVASNIGLNRKYNALPKKLELVYPGAKPFYLVGTIPEYFRKIKQGSNKFREIIKRKHPTRDITNVPRFFAKLGAEPSKNQITLAFKNCHSKIIPKNDIDYKLRAILGKTQFNASLTKWNIAVIDANCFRCGQREDFKHACYLCPESQNLYKDTFQLLNLNPKITVTNMLLSHERPHYIAGERVREEYLNLVDLVSTMTMSHILQARSARKGLEGHKLLLDIRNKLYTIRDKYSKYKPLIDAILPEEHDPG